MRRPSHQRRLMRLERALQRARERRCRHFAHGGVVAANHVAHQLTDAGAVARRDEMQRRKRHEIELERQLTANLLALLGRRCRPIC